jgi:hypothetical protein
VKGLILSLCDFTGNWSRPYERAGYEVMRIDLQNGQDVRLIPFIEQPVHGILAAPPCTHFSRAGAQYWKTRGEEKLLEGLALVDACLRAVTIYRPTWWALENPIGRLKDYLGPPKWKFDPCMFGDPWTKRTWLWGNFTPPMPLFCRNAVTVAPVLGDVTTKLRGTSTRSATPEGFAKAFFEANP